MSKVQKIAALVAVVFAALSIPATGVWWMADHAAWAVDEAEDQDVMAAAQATMAVAVKQLVEIRAHEQTVDETQQAMLRKLCAAGKLKGADCVDVER